MLPQYVSMLADLGIHVEGDAVSKDLSNNLVCCNNTPTEYRGYYSCQDCGKVLDHYVYRDPQLYARNYEGMPNNTGYTIHWHRYYKIRTHFRTHLKQYIVGGIVRKSGNAHNIDLSTVAIDVRSPTAYMDLRQWFKAQGLSHLYRDTWAILYNLGGCIPSITGSQLHLLEEHFRLIEHYFYYTYKRGERHNIPSVFMLLELLLKHVNHQPYYRFPYLKDGKLRERVYEFFDAYVDYLYSGAVPQV